MSSISPEYCDFDGQGKIFPMKFRKNLSGLSCTDSQSYCNGFYSRIMHCLCRSFLLEFDLLGLSETFCLAIGKYRNHLGIEMLLNFAFHSVILTDQTSKSGIAFLRVDFCVC